MFLTAEQRKRLLNNCDGAFRDLVEAGLLTGARYGELRTLLVSDYDKGRRISTPQGKTGRATCRCRTPQRSFSTG